MHELGIISNIFKVIEEVASENNLKKITKVKLKIGKLCQVVPAMIENAFEVVAKETIAKGAALEVEYEPIRMKCLSCQKEFEVDDKIYICPACEQTELEMLAGAEISVESIYGDTGQ